MNLFNQKESIYQKIIHHQKINSFIIHKNHHYYDVIHECEEKLQSLQHDYFDMILLHFDQKNIIKQWYALEQLWIGGYTKSLGVIDISSQSLLKIVDESYLKPMFYYKKKNHNDLNLIKQICYQYGIIFVNQS
ncbi:MAG: aldo/keto reductase [Longibaculum muris]|uniref:Aldo/keto reductase family protein n=1 Tax=Longibaculum muris TaxID=1796628 RepID=A0A4R3Z9V9_9FIRM|nr:aldo/keto reductase [Longibaculum muris]MBS5369261.1 aldo/keto reductase [Coprobacillus cateniformis]MCR1887218.1 aldo/keto reductase [Longibaculum muris]MED9812009.1 aldo/keto reductase [Longibaculum muris]TCW02210.1 aldo/keto reductase family protein [Longibaculum muris]